MTFFYKLPLSFLAIGSIFIGFFLNELLIGLGSDFWFGAILRLPLNIYDVAAETLDFLVKLTPLFASFLGGFLSFLFFN